MVDGLSEQLDALLDGLEASHFYNLANLCCNKIVCVALSVVRMASKGRMKIDPHGPFMMQLEKDLAYIESELGDICKHALGVTEVSLEGLRSLEMALILIRAPPSSPELEETMDFLVRQAESRPTQGGSLAKFTGEYKIYLVIYVAGVLLNIVCFITKPRSCSINYIAPSVPSRITTTLTLPCHSMTQTPVSSCATTTGRLTLNTPLCVA